MASLSSRTVYVEQAGVGRVEFNVETPLHDSNLSGTASFPGHTGKFNGTRTGGAFDLVVNWDTGPSGRYQWTVNSSNTIQGTTKPLDGGGGANLSGIADYLT